MSYIPDLEEREWWHVVDFAYNNSIPENFDAVMVGWIGGLKGRPSNNKIL